MSDGPHKPLLETAAEIGAIAAGIGAIGSMNRLGQIGRTLDQIAESIEAPQRERRRLEFEERQRAESQQKNQAYLARHANEDNWYAPAPADTTIKAVDDCGFAIEEPPVICEPPKHPYYTMRSKRP